MNAGVNWLLRWAVLTSKAGGIGHQMFKIAQRWDELALEDVELTWHFGAETDLLNYSACNR